MIAHVRIEDRRSEIEDQPMWDYVTIVECVRDELAGRAAAADAEQAVYGIDVLDELDLHPIIHEGARRTGYSVHTEQRYPGDRTRRSRSEGKRCDMVLTPAGCGLVDPAAEATLFADDQACDLEAALWIEIKTVAQFDVEGPFKRYSAELLSPVREDVKKLSGDKLIYHAALLLVLFTADAATAEHDLLAWERRCLDKNYPVAPPITRTFNLTDRIGNALCTVAMFPIRRL
jgi:hypothetical protein